MAEIPLPSFETLQKLSAWAMRQTKTYFAVIADPAPIYESTIAHAESAFDRALSFLIFVLIVSFVVSTPIDKFLYGIDVLGVYTIVTYIVLSSIAIVILIITTFAQGEWLEGEDL